MKLRGRALFRLVMLHTIRALGQPFVKVTEAREVASLLVIRPDHLGDILFTTPVLRRLRQALPGARITYLMGPWAMPVISGNGNVDELLPCSFPWFDGRRVAPFYSYSLLFRKAMDLRRRHFDCALNLRFDFWWGAALAYLAGIPRRIGHATSPANLFLSQGVPFGSGAHEVTQNLRLAEFLLDTLNGTTSQEKQKPSEEDVLEFNIHADDQAFADRFLTSHGICTDGGLLVIHPGTRGAAKHWMPERFGEVANILAARRGMAVIVTGTAGERSLANAVANALDTRGIVAAGETTFGQLAALLSRASLVIGVDSGPLHLAAALDRPSVHLYGPSDHIAFAPWGNVTRHAIVRSNYECSPCHRFEWPSNELPEHNCMSSITVEHVLRAAAKVIDGQPV